MALWLSIKRCKPLWALTKSEISIAVMQHMNFILRWVLEWQPMPVPIQWSGRAAGSLVPGPACGLTHQPISLNIQGPSKYISTSVYPQKHAAWWRYSRSSINVDEQRPEVTCFFHLLACTQNGLLEVGGFPALRFLCAHPDTFLSADFGASDSWTFGLQRTSTAAGHERTNMRSMHVYATFNPEYCMLAYDASLRIRCGKSMEMQLLICARSAGTRFRDLVVKVPNPRYVWFAWNLADRNNYMHWLFKKARRKRLCQVPHRKVKVRERLRLEWWRHLMKWMASQNYYIQMMRLLQTLEPFETISTNKA